LICLISAAGAPASVVVRTSTPIYINNPTLYGVVRPPEGVGDSDSDSEESKGGLSEGLAGANRSLFHCTIPARIQCFSVINSAVVSAFNDLRQVPIKAPVSLNTRSGSSLIVGVD